VHQIYEDNKKALRPVRGGMMQVSCYTAGKKMYQN
jgi:hypothetical protein